MCIIITTDCILPRHTQKKVNLQCTGCGSACGVLTNAIGTLHDGSGAASYSNSANCEWLIAPAYATRIMLRFTEFSTQPTADPVRVFQCTDIYCTQQQQLAELSGTYPVTQSATSNTGFIKVAFTSDSASSFDGFAASWTSVRTNVWMFMCVCM